MCVKRSDSDYLLTAVMVDVDLTLKAWGMRESTCDCMSTAVSNRLRGVAHTRIAANLVQVGVLRPRAQAGKR